MRLCQHLEARSRCLLEHSVLLTMFRSIRYGWVNFYKAQQGSNDRPGRGKKRSNILLGWWTRSGDSNKINDDLELLIHKNAHETIDWCFKKTHYLTQVEAVILCHKKNCHMRSEILSNWYKIEKKNLCQWQQTWTFRREEMIEPQTVPTSLWQQCLVFWGQDSGGLALGLLYWLCFLI